MSTISFASYAFSLMHMEYSSTCSVFTDNSTLSSSVDSLDDPKLLTDTLQTRLFLKNAIDRLSGIRAKTKADRFKLTKTDYKPVGLTGYYWYEDIYTPQSNSVVPILGVKVARCTAM